MKSSLRLLVRKWTRFGEFARSIDKITLANVAMVSERTAQRYIRHPDSIPINVSELIQTRVLGLIPDPAFEGWCVLNGKLVSPTAAKYQHLTPGLIEYTGMILGQSRWTERHTAKLEARIRQLESQIDYWRNQAGFAPAANDE